MIMEGKQDVPKDAESRLDRRLQTGRKRAEQVFTEWAYSGHNHGSGIYPKGYSGGGGEGGTDEGDDVALAESALVKFAVLAGHRVAMRTRTALVRRHLDGKELFGVDVLNAERCYRLVLKIERGQK